MSDGEASETSGELSDVTPEGPPDAATEDKPPTEDQAQDTPPDEAPPLDTALDAAPETAPPPDHPADGPAMDTAALDRPPDTAPAPDRPLDTPPDTRDVVTDTRMDTTPCAFPRMVCGGVCVEALLDRNNCGACGRVCANPAHATGRCLGGMCQLECEGGWGDCDGSLVTGCETDLTADGANCGRCRAVCAYMPVTFHCVAGMCALGCPDGLVDCNRDNFCETTPDNDHYNCGACGNVCMPGTICRSGRCVAGTLGRGQRCDPSRGPTCDAEHECAVPYGTTGGAQCCRSPGQFCAPGDRCCGLCRPTGRCCVPQNATGCRTTEDCCETGDLCTRGACLRG
ncbi:MAG: hypothetical protein HY909_30375 [Deltaproteobacteria bacterium]|nr:hypothetical protein [Deltaproteobacteria bacterium]